MTFSAPFIEASNARSTGEVFVMLITIDHDDLDNPICLSSDNKDMLSTNVRGTISNGTEFIYVPFSLTLPSNEKDILPSTKFTIDNVSREITYLFDGLLTPPTVQIQIALASSPNTIEYDLQGLKLNKCGYDELVIECEFSAEYYFIEPYPSVTFTPSRFPGLFKERNSNTGA